MNNKTMIRDLTTGSPIKQLLIFAYPFILSNLLQQAYNLADMIIVGRFVGSAGLTAVSNAGELAVLYLFLSVGFSSAGQIIISQHIGAGNRERISDAIGTLFTSQFILSAVLTVFSLLTCDTFLRLLKVPDEAFGYAHDCAIVYFWGMIPVFGYNTVGAILRGMGDSKRPFIFIAIASVLNVVLDLIFVGPLGMATFGAALATVIAQSVSFIIAVVYLYRRRESFGFDFRLRSFAMKARELRAIISMGLPLSLQNAAVSISMLYINSFINSFGVVSAAATAVGNKITLVATICTGALNTAGASIIAQNFAAGKIDRVRASLGYILLLSMAFCCALAALLLVFPEQIFSIFDSNPQVIAMGPVFAPMGALGLVGFATRATAMSLINGIGNSRLSLVTGLVDGIVARIGLSLLMGITMGMGITGFWWGNHLAGQVFGVVGVVYYLWGKWEKRKLLV